MRNAFLATLLLLCTASLAQGQVTDEQAKLAAEGAVRTAAGYPGSTLLRAHRREDLEDDLFGFQTKILGSIQKAAYFYEVTGEGYFVISPNEAPVVIPSNGRQFELVAVSSRTGQVYLLGRFENASSDFKKLIKDSNVRIGSALDAKRFASFYYTLVADPYEISLVFGSWQLKVKAEAYFYANYADGKADRLFHKWWSSFKSKNARYEFDPQASQNATGYETRIAAMLAWTGRDPRLDEWTLQIMFDGSCEVKQIRTVFPISSKLGTKSSAIRPQQGQGQNVEPRTATSQSMAKGGKQNKGDTGLAGLSNAAIK